MVRKFVYLAMITALMGASAHAQKTITAPTDVDMYCSNVISTQAPRRDIYIISGPEAEKRLAYSQGNTVFINKGADQGVKVGDEFSVSRVEHDDLKQEWFKKQNMILRAMGDLYKDVARLRVVSVQPKISVAEIVQSCDLIYRDDIVQAFTERPAPSYKPAQTFDIYAPSSGKAKAMVVGIKGFSQATAEGGIVYVNLGSAQGVKVGDYFRVFHYPGQSGEYAYQETNTQYSEFGFGTAPVAYKSTDLPRSILGEGIVVRVGPNAATVLVTVSQRDIFAGDYVELE
jgi:hypothetical protein